MEHYAGPVVDAKGKIVKETKAASDPAALIAFLKDLAMQWRLEAGPCRNGFTPGDAGGLRRDDSSGDAACKGDAFGDDHEDRPQG
jgi:hypothetical protein